MINCSCQDTRYFARAYRNPVSTGETDSAYNFRSSTVGEFSPLSFARPSFAVAAVSVPWCETFASFASLPFITILPSPLVHVIADDEFWWKRRDTCASILRAMIETSLGTFISILREKIWKENFFFFLKFLLFVTIDRRIENRSIRWICYLILKNNVNFAWNVYAILSNYSRSLFSFLFDETSLQESLRSYGFIFDKLHVSKLETSSWSRMEERRLDGRFMSRLTRLRLLSRQWQHHAFTTPSGREKGRGRGVTSISLSYRVIMQDLDRSRGWSTISWLNRLINGSRGGSRPICITLAPLPPWNRSSDTVLTHWDCFYEGLFICRTVKDARCQPGNDLCLLLLGLIIILGTICLISPSFHSRRDNLSSCFDYFSMLIAELYIVKFKLAHRFYTYNIRYQIILKVEILC